MICWKKPLIEKRWISSMNVMSNYCCTWRLKHYWSIKVEAVCVIKQRLFIASFPLLIRAWLTFLSEAWPSDLELLTQPIPRQFLLCPTLSYLHYLFAGVLRTLNLWLRQIFFRNESETMSSCSAYDVVCLRKNLFYAEKWVDPSNFFFVGAQTPFSLVDCLTKSESARNISCR